MIQRLKELRTEIGYTQQELGDKLGVSRQAIIALETSKHIPSLDLAYKISALFNRPLEEIWENPYRNVQINN